MHCGVHAAPRALTAAVGCPPACHPPLQWRLLLPPLGLGSSGRKTSLALCAARHGAPGWPSGRTPAPGRPGCAGCGHQWQLARALASINEKILGFQKTGATTTLTQPTNDPSLSVTSLIPKNCISLKKFPPQPPRENYFWVSLDFGLGTQNGTQNWQRNAIPTSRVTHRCDA